MSRTFRADLSWQPRWHLLHRRGTDGWKRAYAHWPTSHSPSFYNTWDYCRQTTWAKRKSSRLRRLAEAKTIHQFLLDYYEETALALAKRRQEEDEAEADGYGNAFDLEMWLEHYIMEPLSCQPPNSSSSSNGPPSAQRSTPLPTA